jgi:hypothetical protein
MGISEKGKNPIERNNATGLIECPQRELGNFLQNTCLKTRIRNEG